MKRPIFSTILTAVPSLRPSPPSLFAVPSLMQESGLSVSLPVIFRPNPFIWAGNRPKSCPNHRFPCIWAGKRPKSCPNTVMAERVLLR